MVSTPPFSLNIVPIRAKKKKNTKIKTLFFGNVESRSTAARESKWQQFFIQNNLNVHSRIRINVVRLGNNLNCGDTRGVTLTTT